MYRCNAESGRMVFGPLSGAAQKNCLRASTPMVAVCSGNLGAFLSLHDLGLGAFPMLLPGRVTLCMCSPGA